MEIFKCTIRVHPLYYQKYERLPEIINLYTKSKVPTKAIGKTRRYGGKHTTHRY